jgi:hypothetical protein
MKHCKQDCMEILFAMVATGVYSGVGRLAESGKNVSTLHRRLNMRQRQGFNLRISSGEEKHIVTV